MKITRIHVEGYRSVRKLGLTLGPLNLLVGPNGCGKTNLYRAVRLVSEAANGRLARAIADEGGMSSVLWAGRRSPKKPVRLTIEVELERFTYWLSLGLPIPSETLFVLDPQVKEERVEFRTSEKKKLVVLERKNASAWVLDEEGRRITFPHVLPDCESVLSEIREPQRFPHLAALRQELLAWRFYHHFRVDADSPIRQPQVGTRTPVLADDGRDLIAALQTIRESGSDGAVNAALGRAFPGSHFSVEEEKGRLDLLHRTPHFRRPFRLHELSDGTLKYLCLVAALLTPRPPGLLALNEPEISIHEDLLEPLAELLVEASRYSQLWVTTHSSVLARHVEERSRASAIRLAKVSGETRLAPSREGGDDVKLTREQLITNEPPDDD